MFNSNVSLYRLETFDDITAYETSLLCSISITLNQVESDFYYKTSFLIINHFNEKTQRLSQVVMKLTICETRYVNCLENSRTPSATPNKAMDYLAIV